MGPLYSVENGGGGVGRGVTAAGSDPIRDSECAGNNRLATVSDGETHTTAGAVPDGDVHYRWD